VLRANKRDPERCEQSYFCVIVSNSHRQKMLEGNHCLGGELRHHRGTERV
jgi:hypothetical protein